MNKDARNFMLLSGILVGSAVGLSFYRNSADMLVNLAVARDNTFAEEIGRSVIAGSGDLANSMQILCNAAEKLENKSSERVEIRGLDGTLLVGHYYHTPNSKRIIIAMHGWRSFWSRDFGIISDFWFDNNCDVLFAEQRAQGESRGEMIGFGLLERYDCMKWIEFVNNHNTKHLPIYLAGVSMGATTVLMSAGLDLPKCVHGIIADCGFTSPSAIWKHVAENNLHIPYWLYNSAVKRTLERRLKAGKIDYSTADAMRVCDTPVLFIHGAEDQFVPVEMTYKNYTACTAPKRLFVVPNAAHGLSYLVDKNGYENMMKCFWSEFDSKYIKK